MANAAAELPDIRVPADDGSVDRAFKELVDAIAAWTTALHEAHRQLADDAAGMHEGYAAATGGSADPLRESRENTDIPEPPPPARQFAEQDRSDEPAGDTSADPRAEDPPRREPTLTHAVPSVPAPDNVTAAVDARVSCAPAIGPTDGTADAPHSPGDVRKLSGEDEALLASLDPEAAQAIKVMRRLSLEYKNVRQLLEEYQAARARPTGDRPVKKSWFRRRPSSDE